MAAPYVLGILLLPLLAARREPAPLSERSERQESMLAA
jgi:hypothetical protein